MFLSRKIALAGLAASLIATPTLSQAAQSTAPTTGPVRDLLVSARDALVLPLGGELLPTLAFDTRAGDGAVAPTTAQRTALGALRGAEVTWNATGTPRSIEIAGGFLSGKRNGAAETIAREWLTEHAAAFGLSPRDIARLELVRDHELPKIGATVISYAQTFGGVASGIGAILTVVVDRRGRVVRYAGDPVRATGLLGSFDLSPAQALQRTVRALSPDLASWTAVATGRTQGGYEVFKAGGLGTTQYVRRVAFPTAQGGRAAFAALVIKSIDEAYAVIVDAQTGRPLFRKSLVQHAEGTIYENYPGAKKGGEPVVKSFGPTETSPGGWLDPTGLLGLPGITTLGNNANTAIAWTVPLVAADQYNRPVAPTGDFNYEFPDSWRTSDGSTGSFIPDANAAATNLFYHHNRIHDELYEFGFTETGGNFQLVNDPTSGSLPLGGDPIMGGAQSGALNLTEAVLPLGRNNANMLTLPDGIPGFTNMYLWEFVDDVFEAEPRDGDFDTSIIQHEYVHGLSNRYVGGGGLGSLAGGQSGAMGEGWGDWYAMNDLFRRGLTRTAVTAAYVGDEKRGIRNWNYASSPLTYGDYGYDMSGPQVHSDGEIWATTLWTVRDKILKAVGGNHKKASDIAEHMVTDAMPLSPPSPSMLDMRDAIVAAAELRYKKKYLDEVWAGFAERGMGASASTTGEADTAPVPGFDVPTSSQNGTVTFRVVNPSTGRPIKGVRVLGGLFEGRTTPITTTNGSGVATVRMAAGRYTLTLQAPGFGQQRLKVVVPRGRKVTRKVALRPNLLSQSSGAKLTKVSSQAAALPAQNAFDDTEATGWQTEDTGVAYNEGKDATAVVKLAKRSVIDTVNVSVVKPIGLPRFAAAKKVTVQTSMNGKSWRTAEVATFRMKGPRPAVSDLMMKSLRLKKPVRAKYVRVVPNAALGDTADYASTAIVAEVQAFGRVSGIEPKQPKPDKPVTTSGSVAVGNIAQGSLLGLDPYRPGVTELSWTGACGDVPSANGVDAWITKLPEGAGDGLHAVTYEGSVPIGEWLGFAYDEDCAPMTGGFALFGETITIPAGAAYVGFLLLYGGGASFDVTITEPR
ncbi:M36 family metallopeptidase [uncultured Nocardioides sp.]|uniref:M36 family metallopeptidase n=1 Tax=uncultured Nocardioides sp. TaxID=198441 RepID=UPI0026228EE0|nr:M36 family metallopeptidase [uncultured Nocardioides sp.]